MEVVNSYASINLLNIIIKNIVKICDMKDHIYRLGYGFFLSKVLDYFKVKPKFMNLLYYKFMNLLY